MTREQEVLGMGDELQAQGKVDESTRAIIIRGLKRIRKIREEEEEAATGLFEDLQDRNEQQEDGMWTVLEECIASWDAEKRRTSSLSTKIWHLAQSGATKAEKLEK